MDVNTSEIVELEEYSVIAIDGRGVWIRDEENNIYSVAGHRDESQVNNKLVQDYSEAVSDNVK